MHPTTESPADGGHAPEAELELDPLTERVRATWTSGDFGRIARGYERGAAEFIGRLKLVPGEPVLDVACGTGNLALPAARAGALVTGVDIAPNLIAQAQANAAREGLPADFEVGDAEGLRYADGAFRTVVTMFGAMFAPRAERAAVELLRVTRPRGRIAMANWAPGGFIGEMLKATVRFVPLPSGVASPLLWGTEDAVRERLGGGCTSLTLTRRLISAGVPARARGRGGVLPPLVRADPAGVRGARRGRARWAAARAGAALDRPQRGDRRHHAGAVGVSGGNRGRSVSRLRLGWLESGGSCA